MQYYHIQTDSEGEFRQELDTIFLEKYGCLYFSGGKKELFLVTDEEKESKEIHSAIAAIYKNKVGVDRYKSITEKEFMASVDKEKLGIFGYFILHASKEKAETQLRADLDVVSELENCIGLADFKDKVNHLIAYLNHQSQPTSLAEKEEIFFIFSGDTGTGRKYAIKFLERLFHLKSVTVNCSEFFLPKTDDKQFPVVYDFYKARPKSKLDFLENLKAKSCTNLCLIIANSATEAQTIKTELQLTYYQVEIIDFPSYSLEELGCIAAQLLTKRQITIDKEALTTIIQENPGLSHARAIRHLIQKIQNFAIAENYSFSSGTSLDLTKFEQRDRSQDKHGNTAQIRLDSMIGLASVKDVLRQQLAFSQIQKLRGDSGEHVDHSHRHLLFSGNSGTGKTEVARLYTEILYENKIIPQNKLVEVGRADLIGEYVGQTAPKVKRVFDSATGGVLFIDEAYSLIPESERDFAHEAIAALIQEMENRRSEVLVILAGYPELMTQFSEVNPGLQSRISREIYFEDYSAAELYEIFQLMLANRKYCSTSACKAIVLNHFSRVKSVPNFGNGRYVRKLIDLVIYHQANRIMQTDELAALSKEELCTISEIDVEKAIQDLFVPERPSRFVGFGIA